MTNTRRDFFRLAAVPLAWRAFDAKLQAAAASRLPEASNESHQLPISNQSVASPFLTGAVWLSVPYEAMGDPGMLWHVCKRRIEKGLRACRAREA